MSVCRRGRSTRADEEAAVGNVNWFEGFESRWKGKDKGQIRGEARSREACSPWFRRRSFE